jgi:hypothetical protein
MCRSHVRDGSATLFADWNFAGDNKAAEGPRLHLKIGTQSPIQREGLRNRNSLLRKDPAKFFHPSSLIPEEHTFLALRKLINWTAWSIDSRSDVEMHTLLAPSDRVSTVGQNGSFVLWNSRRSLPHALGLPAQACIPRFVGRRESRVSPGQIGFDAVV